MLLITSWEYLNIPYGIAYSWWLPDVLEHPNLSSRFCHRRISGRSQGLLGNLVATSRQCGNYSLATFIVTGTVELILLSQLILFSAIVNSVVITCTYANCFSYHACLLLREAREYLGWEQCFTAEVVYQSENVFSALMKSPIMTLTQNSFLVNCANYKCFKLDIWLVDIGQEDSFLTDIWNTDNS